MPNDASTMSLETLTEWAEEDAKDHGMKYAESFRVMILRKDDEEKIG